MEDDLNLFEMNYDINYLKMEQDLNIFENGRRHHLKEMKDDLIFQKMEIHTKEGGCRKKN